jgi:hypothetical protein
MAIICSNPEKISGSPIDQMGACRYNTHSRGGEIPHYWPLPVICYGGGETLLNYGGLDYHENGRAEMA